MVMNGGLMFDQSWALLGFVVFILLFISDHYSKRKKRIIKIMPKNLRIKFFVSRLFFGLFLACLIIAIAGHRWGIGQTSGEFRRALDAVIAIDVSRSMDLRDGMAADMTGGLTGDISRLERGVSIVREAVETLPGMRFAIALSRNRGVIATPLSWDNSTVLSFLEAVDGSSLTGRGTNLESLVDAAADAFQSSHHSSRVILLVSDGEELSGSLRAALGRCSANGIIVTTIAVGSDEGRPLPANEDILSRRDSNIMRIAARETGGLYIDGNREDAAEALGAHLRSLAAESRTGEGRSERKARWFIYAAAAMMAYGASRSTLLRMEIGE